MNRVVMWNNRARRRKGRVLMADDIQDGHRDHDEGDGDELVPGLNEILNAKPDLLAGAADALGNVGKGLAQRAEEFENQVLVHFTSTDPEQRATAADRAARLGREIAGETERLRLVDVAIAEALPGSSPVAEAMSRFCRQWEKTLQSLQDDAEQAATFLRRPNPDH